MDKKFIAETSNAKKLKIFFVIIFIVLTISVLLIGSTIYFESGREASFNLFSKEVKNPSLFGLFFLSFLVNVFFIPLPFEPLIILALQKSSLISVSLSLILLGVLTANFINYYIGEKFSNTVFLFISRKKVYRLRKWTSKYGDYAALLANLIPGIPFPLLSFGLGIAKYNFIRLTIFTLIGNILKFIAIITLYRFFQLTLF